VCSSDLTTHETHFEVHDGRLDFVADYTAPTGFFSGGQTGQPVQLARWLTAKEARSGEAGAGKPAVMILFGSDASVRTTRLEVTGSARLLRLPQQNGQAMDLWMIEKGKGTFDAALEHIEGGAAVSHQVLAKKAGLEAGLRGAGLL
jgi:hypothetical protein